MIKATFHLGTYTTNSKGGKIMHTKYSQYDRVEFPSIKEARIYAQGMLSGLRYKWMTAAVAMDIDGKETEYFTD